MAYSALLAPLPDYRSCMSLAQPDSGVEQLAADVVAIPRSRTSGWGEGGRRRHGSNILSWSSEAAGLTFLRPADPDMDVPTTPRSSVPVRAARGIKTRCRFTPARGGVMKKPDSGQSSKLCERMPSNRSPSRKTNRVHSPGTLGRRSNKLCSEKRSACKTSETKQRALNSPYGTFWSVPSKVINSMPPFNRNAVGLTIPSSGCRSNRYRTTRLAVLDDKV